MRLQKSISFLSFFFVFTVIFSTRESLYIFYVNSSKFLLHDIFEPKSVWSIEIHNN